ncbi:MAG: O-antigen polysaccharide polymerase Wzy [Thermoleophilaceae bacterium]|nr:O-antigen polysaccharide polymerase Wzy [Thermoleophilaceae bacterium]
MRRGAPAAPLAAAALLAFLAVLPLLIGMPVAWSLLAVCALVTASGTAWGLATRRFLEPLPLIAAVGLLIFVARPLQLFLGWRDLYSHFAPDKGPVGLVLLENQEIALFVTQRLREPLEPALTRAIGATALFLVLFAAGYLLPAGRRLAGRLARAHGPRAGISVRTAVAAALAIGFAAQAAIIARAGGPGPSLRSANEQAALSDSFVLFVLAGFGFAGMVVWAAWRRPSTRLEWAGFVGCVLANCGFATIAGSRARILLALLMLAVIKHYLWSPWRLRQLAAGMAVFVVFAGAFVAFRQAANVDSIGEAIGQAPKYGLEPRVILNDLTAFDDVFYVTTTYGQRRPHQNGDFLLGGVRSYLPAAVDPGKPEGGDIVLRRAVFGESTGAGRPPTVIGDLYIDFGFPGVAIGALLLGMAARGLTGLVLGSGPGREYRVALYAVALIVLYELVVDSFSIALGYALAFGIPLVATVHALGRLRRGSA